MSINSIILSPEIFLRLCKTYKFSTLLFVVLKISQFLCMGYEVCLSVARFNIDFASLTTSYPVHSLQNLQERLSAFCFADLGIIGSRTEFAFPNQLLDQY